MDNPTSPPPTSGKAIAALCLGIAAIPTCMCYGVPSMICGVLAIIFGLLASKEIRTGERAGKGMVTAGYICGGIGIFLSVVFWIVLVTVGIKGFKEIQKQQQAQQQSQQQP